MNTITGTVEKVIRHGHTVYGNPIISVALEGENVGDYGYGVFRISDNASLVYAIENAEFREQPHTFVLTRAGRISHLAPCAVCGAMTRSHDRFCPREVFPA